VFAKLAMTEAMLTESKDRPRGPLKVTTTVAFGSAWLTPRMREFLDLHPEIEVSLVVDDDELDLSMREADVAIRMSPPRQPDLVQRHLMTIRYPAYASKEYLKKHGTPHKAEDLDKHRLIIYGSDNRPAMRNVNWVLEAGAHAGHERRAILAVNNIYAMCKAVQSGLGIAAIPDFMQAETQDLVRVLPEVPAAEAEAYFVYPEELRTSKRIAVFRDFLLRKVGENKNGG